jgi:hypothetical protein
MRIYSRCESTDYGGDVSLALDACQRFPEQWTTRPWIRPGGAPQVDLPPNWQEKSANRRIEFARQIKKGDVTGEHPAAMGITDAGIADEIIRGYLSGSQHPGGGVARATPHKEELAAAIIADRSAA